MTKQVEKDGDKTWSQPEFTQEEAAEIVHQMNVLMGVEPARYETGSHCPVDFGVETSR